jgi:hypothetical protein
LKCSFIMNITRDCTCNRLFFVITMLRNLNIHIEIYLCSLSLIHNPSRFVFKSIPQPQVTVYLTFQWPSSMCALYKNRHPYIAIVYSSSSQCFVILICTLKFICAVDTVFLLSGMAYILFIGYMSTHLVLHITVHVYTQTSC